MADPGVLYIGCPPETPERLRRGLPGLPVHPIELDQLPGHLDGSKIVLIGPDVDRPIEAAQRVHRLDRRAQLLIASRRDRLAQVAQSLKFSPFVGISTRALPIEDVDGLCAALRTAIGRAEQHRALERSLQSARAHLPQTGPATGDYEQVLERLEAQEVLLAAVVESTDDAILSRELDGTLTSWNKAAETLYGWRAEEIIGRNIDVLVPPDRREELREIDGNIRLGRAVDHLETVRVDRYGQRIDVSLTVSPIRIGGRIVGASGIARDCTERRHRERLRNALSKLSERLNASLRDAQGLFDEATRLVGRGFAGACALVLLDDAEQALRPCSVYDSDPRRAQVLQRVLAEQPLPARDDVFARVLETREPLFMPAVEADVLWAGFSEDHRRELGELGVSSAIVAPLASDQGAFGALAAFGLGPDGHFQPVDLRRFTEAAERIAAAIVNARLLEQLQSRTDELTRSNQELELFASVASHDLQEPLRMVSAYTGLLADHLGDDLDEEAAEYVRFAVDGATRMRQLLNDLLAYARVGSSRQALSPVNVDDVVHTVRSNLQIALAEQAAELTCDPLPAVLGDRTQLVQLFQNLISNALKFRSEDAPRIQIGAEPDGTLWRFSVRDNGIGIAPKFSQRIFVMFKRLHTRSEYPGRGIGLAIAMKIVERHGGKIWVESNRGQGATFHFTLPAAPG